jgi:chaperone LolA
MLVWLAAPAAARARSVDEIWAAYQKRWASTSTYEASFRQTIEISGIGGEVLSAGRFYFSRPDRMRWDYTEGDVQRVIGDGRWIWVYQPDLEQAYKIDYKAAFGSGGLVALLADREGLSQRYVLELIDETTDSVTLRLSPKQGAGETLDLQMSADTMDLESVVVSDPAGSVTHVEFHDIKRNVAVDAGLFVFTPPDGVDIITPPAATN